MANKLSRIKLDDSYSDFLSDAIGYTESLSSLVSTTKSRDVEQTVRKITYAISDIEKDWSDIKTLLLGGSAQGYKHALIVTPNGFMLKNGGLEIDLLIITVVEDKVCLVGYNSIALSRVWNTETIKTSSPEAELLFSGRSLGSGLRAISSSGVSSDEFTWTDQTKFNWMVFRSEGDSLFTRLGSFDLSEISNRHICSKYEISENVENKPQTVKVGNKMASTKLATTATTVLAKNKTAAVQAAKVTTGKIAIKQVTKIISPKLPIMARGYVDTPLGRLAVANLFNFVVTQYLPNSQKASLVADAMLEGAMFDVASSLDIEGLVENVLEGIDTSKLQKAIEAKMKEEEE